MDEFTVQNSYKIIKIFLTYVYEGKVIEKTQK